MRRRPESIRKLAIIIIIPALIFNMVVFLMDVKEIGNSDPPKVDQIIIPEPLIDSIR